MVRPLPPPRAYNLIQGVAGLYLPLRPLCDLTPFPFDNALHLVERGITQAAGNGPVAALPHQVAVGVVGEVVTAGVADRMRAGLADAVDIAAHVALVGDVAQGIIRHRLLRVAPHLIGGQPVQGE